MISANVIFPESGEAENPLQVLPIVPSPVDERVLVADTSNDEKTMTSVSVVVCTHSAERRQLLEDILRSINAGASQPNEVLIVVDRNPALFAELSAHPWSLLVRVLESSGSGLAAARNTGWRAARGSLVAFIDDDAVASPGWLRELTEAAERHRADVVGGWVEPHWTHGEPAWFSPLLGWVVGCSYEGLPTVPSRVRNVIGCNMLIRRDLLERLGGFETTLGRSGGGLAGCEETELCIRANRSGAEVMMIPGARVAQVLPATRGTLSHAVRRGWHEGRSKRMLVRLHGPVLRTETIYATTLLRRSGAQLARGVLMGRPRDVMGAIGLVAVLGATTLSYFVYAVVQPASTSGHAT